MSTPRFHYLLSTLQVDGKPLNLARLADLALCSKSHAHLSQVLNNRPGRGKNTRRKVERFFRERFPKEAAALLQELGWDLAVGHQEVGTDVATATFHEEQER